MKRVILLGDSITEQAFSSAGCWGSLLANQFRRRADVINRGFSGYNTRWLLAHLDTILEPHTVAGGQPAVTAATAVVIFLGANAAARLPSFQHVPVEEYGANLVSLVQRVREKLNIGSNSRNVILVTPPPFHERSWLLVKGCATSDRTALVTQQYAQRAVRAAVDADCGLVDLHSLFLSAAEGSPDKTAMFLDDGLHLNVAGAALVYKALVLALYDFLPPATGAEATSTTAAQPFLPHYSSFKAACEATDA